MDALEKIANRRRERIRIQGNTLGVRVPETRLVPLVPFGRPPFLICEIKRRSPSRGWIAEGLDAVRQASEYARRGIASLSVLTEEDHFSGSLADLMEVKAAVPDRAVLRKDFLLDEEDIVVSHRAGADAVLLIARLLSAGGLAALHAKAESLGMEALVEVHDEEDCAKARLIKPALTGINCRDLGTFTTDLLHPVKVKRLVDWPTRLVFESGIRSEEDALLALSSGFSGILAGEAVVRDPGLVEDLIKAFGGKAGDFWRRLCERERPDRPLVKICGITREEDAERAVDLGADILGFVLAPSPRRTRAELLEKLRGLDTLKVAVVVGGAPRTEGTAAPHASSTTAADGRGAPGDGDTAADAAPGPAVDDGGTATAARLLEQGLIDAVQFHGDETPDECFRTAFPYFKVLRLGDPADVAEISRYRCPRVLVDAAGAGARGGTGRKIPEGIVSLVKERHPLWLAGGLGPENIREIVERFTPELVDASSRLESAPGIKDTERMKAFFKEMGRE